MSILTQGIAQILNGVNRKAGQPSNNALTDEQSRSTIKIRNYENKTNKTN